MFMMMNVYIIYTQFKSKFQFLNLEYHSLTEFWIPFNLELALSYQKGNITNSYTIFRISATHKFTKKNSGYILEQCLDNE